MEIVDNFGILAPIAWNSTGWTQALTVGDLKTTNFGYVKEHQEAAENLNFGHLLYPAEADGSYIGYSPKLNASLTTELLGAVFFLSTDHTHGYRCVVGVYGFPQVGTFKRKAKHKLFKKYESGNVCAQVDDIVYFDKPVVLANDVVTQQNLLPAGKSLAKRGFNYLTSENVVNLLRLAAKLNRHNAVLARLLHRLETDPVDNTDLSEGLSGLSGLGLNPEVNTLAGIANLEKKMQKLRPQAKEQVAVVIERGHIAAVVKRHTGYKCLLCEAMGYNPLGFIKSNGVPYVETHHVDPVANRTAGALGLANLITVCANHHRQLHYGNAGLVKQTKTQFVFVVEGQQVVIKKIKP
jgi:hypothetical protein